MPRHARLDVPGTLHHVMVRGIEGSNIFQDEEDRQVFVERLRSLVREAGVNEPELRSGSRRRAVSEL